MDFLYDISNIKFQKSFVRPQTTTEVILHYVANGQPLTVSFGVSDST